MKLLGDYFRASSRRAKIRQSQPPPVLVRAARLRRAGVLSGLLLAFAMSAGGCNAIDCSSICDRYKECFDRAYDTSECRSRCRNETSVRNADACSECLDAHACVSSPFACGAQCAGIIP